MSRMGQVGILTKNPGWYGRLVQWFTGSPAYHAVFVTSDRLCVSAETPRIMMRPLSHFDGNGIVWTDVTYASDAARESAVRFAFGQVGKPYAYWDIVLLVVARILKTKTPKRILRRVQDRRQWFCSELCDAALEAGGVELFPMDRPPQAVTPADFLAAVQSAHSPQDGQFSSTTFNDPQSGTA